MTAKNRSKEKRPSRADPERAALRRRSPPTYATEREAAAALRDRRRSGSRIERVNVGGRLRWACVPS